MTVLFFDTETTGIPIDWKAPMSQVDNWPRVISLAFILQNEAGLPLAERHYLIRPDGWTMPTGEFWVQNGFSQEKSLAEGVPVLQALQEFILAVNSADALCAHNMAFDYNVVGAELIRAGVKAERKLARYCTMKSTTDLLQLPGKFGFKFPKLQELHSYLFSSEFDGAHDALHDVRATSRCFWELHSRGHFNIQNESNQLNAINT